MSNNFKCKESEKSGKINFRSSRSVLNALRNLFRVPNIPNTTIVDSNLLAFAGGVKPGLSPEKIAARIIQRKSEAGLPVGALVGGDSAPDEIMEKIRIEEMVKAFTEEARIDVCTRPGTQLQATGGNAGGPIQVFGTLISTSCGHGQIF
jgi:hypothetical protein